MANVHESDVEMLKFHFVLSQSGTTSKMSRIPETWQTGFALHDDGFQRDHKILNLILEKAEKFNPTNEFIWHFQIGAEQKQEKSSR